MAPKRKLGSRNGVASREERSAFDAEETFGDSQDEFFTGQDKILLDEEPATKRRRKIEEQERNLLPPDEEVLQYRATDSEDDFSDEDVQDENFTGASRQHSDEDENGHDDWGTSRVDYYNADNIETEADALEEETEARRLYQKQVKSMTIADFGFDETLWNEESQSGAAAGKIVEKLPDTKIPKGATHEERLDILRNRYPEFQPLAEDFLGLQAEWRRLYELRTQKQFHDSRKRKLRALSSYLGSIAMYMAVLSSNTKQKIQLDQITALAPLELQEHAIINNLMSSRGIWDVVKDEDETEDTDEPISPESVIRNGNSSKSTTRDIKSIVVSDKNALNEGLVTRTMPTRREESVKIPGVEPEPTETNKGTKKGTKKEKRKKQTSISLGIKALLDQSGPDQNDESDFGDEGPLTEEQLAEKARKKKTLRFYSSQIVQKANKRGAASREAGGDDDVPRKERLRDRQERLMKEAEKRGQQAATEFERLNDNDDVENVMHTHEDDDYYKAAVSTSQRKKEMKQARTDAYTEAAKLGPHVYTEEQVGPDGKRAITYAIAKNKGLMPKRKKDVRNPRVKKRKKYDEKKKKLGSMRQVYKGGEGRGGYGGELTGIKTNVVKSVKL